MSKFAQTMLGVIPALLGYALGSVVGTVSPGYSYAMWSLLAIPIIIFAGSRIEVWLIEFGWIK